MDNLTHTLIGAVAGEVLARSTRPSATGLVAGTRRNVLVVVSALGSNLPDIDLAWTWRGFGGSGLSYVLEHRGYTHTLVGCAALAVLLYIGTLWWLGWRRQRPSSEDRKVLAIAVAVALFAHLGMDALNSYGVHPFWPWNNRWYYGDALFIVEPLYWLAALPLLFVFESLAARIVLGAAAVVAVAAVVGLHRAGILQGLLVLILAGGLAYLGRRCTPRTAAWAAAAAMALVTVCFLAASQRASAQLQTVAAGRFVHATTLDSVLTPTPTNPGCWDVWLLQTESRRYTARHGMLTLGAGDPAQCGRIPQGPGGAAVLQAVAAPASPGVQWLGEMSIPVERFAQLASEDCAVRELLQFVRAPFAIERQGHWIVGDLRFDRGPGVGFASVDLAPSGGRACHFTAPWVAPRADLLAR